MGRVSVPLVVLLAASMLVVPMFLPTASAWTLEELQDHLDSLIANRTDDLIDLRDTAAQQWLETSNRNRKCDFGNMCDSDLKLELSDSGLTAFPQGNETFARSSVKIRGHVDNPGLFWRDICVTDHLDQPFTDVFTAAQESVSYQFIGTQSEGIFRTYPGYFWGDVYCPDAGYDPRFRPWYSAAAAGPKDVVILMDTSASMASDDRLAAAQDAAKALIGSLSFYDYANVVFFSDQYVDGSLQAFPTLRQMTGSNRQALRTFVDLVFTDGDAQFDSAFSKAFDVLADSAEIGATSQCAKVILFITDGETNGNDPRTVIRERNTEHDARIFTYTLGDDAGTRVANQIACENKGIHYHLPSNTEVSLRSQISELYRYFAAREGLKKGDVKLSEIYEIAGDVEGWLVSTAVLPVFDTTATPESLIGVVGMDIPLAELTQAGTFPTANVTAELERRARDVSSCPELSLTEADIDALRSVHGQECDAGLSTLYQLLIAGGALLLLAVLYAIYRIRAGRKAAQDENLSLEEVESLERKRVQFGPILSNMLAVADYAIHWLFVFELVSFQESQLAVTAGGILIAGAFLNVALGLRSLVSFKANEAMRLWILRRPLAVAIVTLFTGINLDGMTLLNCNLKLPFVKRLDAPIEAELMHRLTRLGIISNLTEDVPFLVIQSILSSEERSASQGPIQNASLIISIASLVISAIKRVAFLRMNPLGKALGDIFDPTDNMHARRAREVAKDAAAPPSQATKLDNGVEILGRGLAGAEIDVPTSLLPSSDGPAVVVIPGAALATATRRSSTSRRRLSSTGRRGRSPNRKAKASS